MNKRIYAAGPITGLSYAGSTQWREYAAKKLSRFPELQILSPMRGKDYLLQEQVVADEYDNVLSTAKGITTRDRNDVLTCDLILVNLLGSGDRISIGTIIELGWADAFRKPVVLCIEKDNKHQHAMVREIAGFVVDDLDQALDICVAVLAPVRDLVKELKAVERLDRRERRIKAVRSRANR